MQIQLMLNQLRMASNEPGFKPSMDCCKTALGEIERLQAGLPKTADGVIAHDGMRVFMSKKQMRDEGLYDDDGIVAFRVNNEAGLSYINEWHSTREAAEAAEAAGGK